MNNRTLDEKIFDWINVILLAIVALIMLFPMFYILVVSFSSLTDVMQNDLLLWPKKWVTDAYQYIFSSQSFIRSIFVTIYITIVGTLVNLIFTSTMGYALSRNFYGQKFVMFLVLFSFLFSAGMIPTYLVVKETMLIDTLWALIIPVAISPFNLIVMRQFFRSIPEELIESAVIDGASQLQIFPKIILPLSKPSLAAFGLFYAVTHWNTYFTGILYLHDTSKWPIQVVLRQIVIVNQPDSALGTSQMMTELQPPPETVQMAAILVATLPILVVYPFLQKHFAKGVMLGSIKG